MPASAPLLGTVTFGTLSVVTLLVGIHRDHFPTRAAAKTLAATAFLIGAVLAGVPGHGPAGGAVFAGLLLSWLGDVLLLADDRRVFLAGLGSFLLGHVAYTAAFWILGVDPLGLGIAGVAMLVAAIGVWSWLGPHAGHMRLPVLAYIAVISAMAASAAGAAWLDPSPSRLVLLTAAVLFFLSDLGVARQRFVAPDPLNRFLGLPLYFIAQWGFVFGMQT